MACVDDTSIAASLGSEITGTGNKVSQDICPALGERMTRRDSMEDLIELIWLSNGT